MFKILGYIFIGVIVFHIIMHIVLLIHNFFTKDEDNLIEELERSSIFYVDKGYANFKITLLPSITVYNYNNTDGLFGGVTVDFTWICFVYSISYHYKNERETNLMYKAIQNNES